MTHSLTSHQAQHTALGHEGGRQHAQLTGITRSSPANGDKLTESQY